MTTSWHRLELQRKLVILVVTITGLILGLALGTATWHFNNINTAVEYSQLQTEAALVGEYAIPSLVFIDREGAREILEKLGNVRGVIYAAIYQANDSIFAEYLNDSIAVQFDVNAAVADHRGFFSASDPISYRGEYYGRVLLLARNEQFEFLMESVLPYSVLLFAALLIIAGTLTYLLQRSISHPIRLLADRTAMFDGENDVLPIEGFRPNSAEIRTLHESFERMASELNKKIVSLRNNSALLAEKEERMRGLVKHLETVRESERTRIARELHDDLGQYLTAISMDAHTIFRSIGNSSDPDKSATVVLKTATQMLELLDITHDTLRAIIKDLRPPVLDNLGFPEAAAWYLEEFSERYSLETSLHTKALPENFSSGISVVLFRVLQESLTNVAKHAQAQHVFVSIVCANGTIKITVIDDGVGLDGRTSEPNRHFGIIGMQERVHSVGGTFSISSSSEDGTRVTATVPAEPGTEKVDVKP